MDLVAPPHVGSSWTRDQTLVPCFRRRILNHWTTREVPWEILPLLPGKTSSCLNYEFYSQKQGLTIREEP